MNYDNMSVEELLPLYNWNIINATLGKITEDAAGRRGFELFTAIRKAVVREASVGLCSIRYANAKRIDMDEIRIKSIFLEKNWERVWIDYDLIPKETP